MKKVQSVYAEEETLRDLKLLALVNEIPIGDMLDRLVRDEIARMDRTRRNYDLAGSSRSAGSENGQRAEKRVERKARKKKRGF